MDAESGELVALSTLGDQPDEDRYVRLPRWGPAEGFHLMESFVTSLDNPAYREQLSRALTMGQGVFRAFKDALKQNKEIEKLWFAYKEQRLRAVIVSWYNVQPGGAGPGQAARGARGDRRAGDERFFLHLGNGRSPAGGGAARSGRVLRAVPHESPERLEERFAEKRHGLPPPGGEFSPLLIAETPDGELAGFAWGVIDGTSVHIVQLAVTPALRGSGLGEIAAQEVPHGDAQPWHAAPDHRAHGEIAAILRFLPLRGIRHRHPDDGVQPSGSAPGEPCDRSGRGRLLGRGSCPPPRRTPRRTRASAMNSGSVVRRREEAPDVSHRDGWRNPCEKRLVVG